MTAIRRSRAPAAASIAIMPPTPSTSSSGCAATTATLGQDERVGCRQLPQLRPRVPSACSAVPGASMRFGGGRAHHAAPRLGHQAAELGQVALGMMLAEVDGQVGDPAGVRLVVAQRARPERPADPLA